MLEAVTALKAELLARLDGSDRLTEEKFKAVHSGLRDIKADIAAVKAQAEDAIATTKANVEQAIDDVSADTEAAVKKVSAVELTVARMLGWSAGAGAVAGLVVGIILAVLKVLR